MTRTTRVGWFRVLVSTVTESTKPDKLGILFGNEQRRIFPTRSSSNHMASRRSTDSAARNSGGNKLLYACCHDRTCTSAMALASSATAGRILMVADWNSTAPSASGPTRWLCERGSKTKSSQCRAGASSLTMPATWKRTHRSPPWQRDRGRCVLRRSEQGSSCGLLETAPRLESIRRAA